MLTHSYLTVQVPGVPAYGYTGPLPLRSLLHGPLSRVHFGEALIVRLYSEIDQIHLSSEAQCVSHHLPLVDCHTDILGDVNPFKPDILGDVNPFKPDILGDVNPFKPDTLGDLREGTVYTGHLWCLYQSAAHAGRHTRIGTNINPFLAHAQVSSIDTHRSNIPDC